MSLGRCCAGRPAGSAYCRMVEMGELTEAPKATAVVSIERLDTFPNLVPPTPHMSC